MLKTDTDVVGEALDESRIKPIHVRIFALISAGYFVDVIDYAVFGAMIPIMLHDHFATRGGLAIVAGAQLFGLAIGTLVQGQFTDRIGRKTIYQFNLLLFGLATIAAGCAPNVMVLAVLRFIAGLGLGAEQPLAFAYAGEFAPKRLRGRMLAIVHLIGGALSWPIAAILTLFLSDILGWRAIWIFIGIGALIVFALRFSLPESPRWLVSRGHTKKAFKTLEKMKISAQPTGIEDTQIQPKSDPFMVVFSMYARRMIMAAISLSCFFCVTIGLGTWLPNIMHSKGFTITKSLTYTFTMMLAVPCASLCMMYALDKFGRKKTGTIAFIAASIMAVVFAMATSNAELLIAGFIMVFFYQIAGNTAQIFTSEVFPTHARASGFGMAAGTGRFATAIFVPVLPMIQSSFGLYGVFFIIAALLCTAAVSLNFIGPETRKKSLEEVVARPV